MDVHDFQQKMYIYRDCHAFVSAAMILSAPFAEKRATPTASGLTPLLMRIWSCRADESWGRPATLGLHLRRPVMCALILFIYLFYLWHKTDLPTVAYCLQSLMATFLVQTIRHQHCMCCNQLIANDCDALMASDFISLAIVLRRYWLATQRRSTRLLWQSIECS